MLWRASVYFGSMQPTETFVYVCVVVCCSLARMNLNMLKKYYLCAQTEGISSTFRTVWFQHGLATSIQLCISFDVFRHWKILAFPILPPFIRMYTENTENIVCLQQSFICITSSNSALSCARRFWKFTRFNQRFFVVLSWLQAACTSSVWYHEVVMDTKKYIFSISQFDNKHNNESRTYVCKRIGSINRGRAMNAKPFEFRRNASKINFQSMRLYQRDD